ncbi:hypothetical protein ABZ667_04535 [Streptomyces lavendulae]|uniref:nSTAND1 domain-containing NTPase n=1 Tax=Streptomyces lavendulae TaxID=1914 RepID=UPI0033FAAC68
MAGGGGRGGPPGPPARGDPGVDALRPNARRGARADGTPHALERVPGHHPRHRSGRRAARGRGRRAAGRAAEREIADAFVTGRLLTSDAGVLDLAHEALLRRWPPLHAAVEAHVERLRQRGRGNAGRRNGSSRGGARPSC